MLQTRAHMQCQGVLTVGNGARAGILDALQRCIDLEHVSDVLRALIFEAIQCDAANEGAYAVSGGADSRQALRGGVLERSEGLVLLQALREVLGGLSIEVIRAQTAKR